MYVVKEQIGRAGLGDSPAFSVTFYDAFTNESYPLSAVPTTANWKVKIDGAAPGAAVAYTTTGATGSASYPVGIADASGHFDMTFSQLVGAEGTWSTVWTVGGVVVGSYQLTVVPGYGPSISAPLGTTPPGSVASAAAASTTSAAASSAAPSSAAVVSAPADSVLPASVSFLSDKLLGVPVWLWGLGSVGAWGYFSARGH